MLTYDYQLNAELARLLPGVPVVQANEPERYDFLERPLDHLAGTGLVVSRDEIDAGARRGLRRRRCRSAP